MSCYSLRRLVTLSLTWGLHTTVIGKAEFSFFQPFLLRFVWQVIPDQYRMSSHEMGELVLIGIGIKVNWY